MPGFSLEQLLRTLRGKAASASSGGVCGGVSPAQPSVVPNKLKHRDKRSIQQKSGDRTAGNGE